MGNYLTIEAMCISGRIMHCGRGKAAVVLAILCHLADSEGIVPFERRIIVDRFGMPERTWADGIAVLRRVGAVRALRQGTPGTPSWRRLYQLTGMYLADAAGTDQGVPA